MKADIKSISVERQSPVFYKKIDIDKEYEKFLFVKLREKLMMGIFFTWIATALSLLLVDLAVPGVNIATFPAALIAAISIGFLNSSVKPILSTLSLPLNF
jgi:hypothetical protein